MHLAPLTSGSVIEILGIPIACLDLEEAISTIEHRLLSGPPAVVAHVNAHTLNLAYSDPGYAAVLRRADLVLNDGKGVMLAAMIHGRRFPADLNGNRLAPLLLRRSAERGWRVFFLGARPGVAKQAADKLQDHIDGLNVVGTRDGFFKHDEEAIDAIRSTHAQLLFVGMGNPLQEQFLDRCLSQTGARVGVGVGAFFDFTVGRTPRAPGWMNRAGIEWVHRLAQEPRRLWRRYIIGNPQFLFRTLNDRFDAKPASK